MLVACAALVGGCWFSSSPPPTIPRRDQDDLPDKVGDLLKLAEASSREDASLEELERAVRAYEKMERLVREQPSTIEPSEIHWRLARTCFLASEAETEGSAKLAWQIKGEDAAERFKTDRPDRVEGYYYLAALRGRRAEQGGLGGFVIVYDVEKLGLKAAEIDPHFENAGPYRLLAMLYAKAPPWPTSVGDIDEALDYADLAVETADYPLNRLMRAEVLIEAGEMVDARIELQRVLAAPKIGKWAREGERWRPYAARLLRTLEE